MCLRLGLKRTNTCLFVFLGGEYNKVVDLLFVRDEGGNSHYACMKNMSRLISSSHTKHGHKTYFCRYCLSHFGREHLWEEHTRLCSKHEFTRVEMPEKGSVSKFRVMVIYVDF